MCGRFVLAIDPAELQEAFAGVEMPPPEALQPRYNIAPTQPVAVIPNDGQHRLDFYVWGLIPSWAKDPKIGNRMINARAETLAEKPSFRAAYKRRRCLIPASGFYEWRRAPGGKTKTPMYIGLRSGAPFALAGLWESWWSPEGDQVLSCTIITTSPNELLAPIHNRMPVILPAAGHDLWLDPGELAADRLQGLLQPYPADEMRAYAVSTAVNNPRNDTPECIQPIP
ncbi:MAG: SOS response-associated peptidase [Anaerolineales bacterium]